MRQTSYKFLDITKLPPEIEQKVKAAIATGTVRVITEHATGLEYVSGEDLHKIWGIEHGIAGYVNVD